MPGIASDSRVATTSDAFEAFGTRKISSDEYR